MDYNWRNPAQRIEMSNQYGWRQQPKGFRTTPGGYLPPVGATPQIGTGPYNTVGMVGGGGPTYSGAQSYSWAPGLPGITLPGSHTPPTIPGGAPGPVPPGIVPDVTPSTPNTPFNPWHDSGIGGNNPLDYTVPTDSHNVVQIPGLPPVQNPPIESGGPQISNPPGYAHGGVIPPGLERYRKLLKGNWTPTDLNDPDSLYGYASNAGARRT